MWRGEAHWLLAGVLCLTLFPAIAFGQAELWEKYTLQGSEAYEKGDYAEAERLYLAAFKEAERLGKENPRYATSLFNLALLYNRQKKYAQAEQLYKQLVAVRGSESDLVGLATAYAEQGKYSEAEPIYKQTLAARERWAGPEHPAVADTLEALATLYIKQGRYVEAAPLLERALAIHEKAEGSDDLKLVTTLHDLALVYLFQQEYAQAESFRERALAIMEKALGPEHPEVVQAFQVHASFLRKVGREAEAQELEARASKTTGVSSALSEVDPAKETDIRRLMEVMGARRQFAEMKPVLAEQMKPLVEQFIMPKLPPDLRDPKIPERAVQRFWERFDLEELTKRLIPVYDNYYTHEEVKELIQFFETPLGKRLSEILPQLSAESYTIGSAYGQEVGEQVGLEIADEILSKRKK